MPEELGWILGFQKFLRWTLTEAKINQRECTSIHLLKSKHNREYILKSVCPTKDKPKTWCPVTATCHFALILHMITRYICTSFRGFRDFQCLTPFMWNFPLGLSPFHFLPTSRHICEAWNHLLSFSPCFNCYTVLKAPSLYQITWLKIFLNGPVYYIISEEQINNYRQKHEHHRTTLRASSGSPFLHPHF